MAIIYTLPIRRHKGRPKQKRPEEDMGTPELQSKRAEGQTMETLDLCLSRGLITEEQHWCGIHLRWLYTLRFGAPGVRAIDHNHVSGLVMEQDDPEWRAAREAEYHEAVKRLTRCGLMTLLSNLCIHNERPDFLSTKYKKLSPHNRDLEKLCDGLDLLARHWRRQKTI